MSNSADNPDSSIKSTVKSMGSSAEKSVDSTKKVFLGAFRMSLGTLSSRFLGLLRDIVLTSYFDRKVTDAFVVAFKLPNMFRRLFGEGALSVSFMPVLVEKLGSKKESLSLVSGVYSFLFLFSSALTVLGILFMEPLLRALVGGEGFLAVPGKLELAVTLARFLFLYLLLVLSYAFFMAILNAFGRFFWPALAPAIFNLSLIIFALMPQSVFATPGLWLAVGVIVGGVLQLAMVAVPVYRLKLFPKFVKFWKNKDSLFVLKNTLPGIWGMGVIQIMGLLNLRFASHLGEGSHTFIYASDRILELPQSLIAISLGAALLPTLSKLWSQKDIQKFVEVGSQQWRLLLFLALPSAVGLYSLALPIVQLLFERGAFTYEQSLTTASIVKVYAVLLIIASSIKIIAPQFFAQKNTKIPAWGSTFSLLIHAALGFYSIKTWGLVGLAYSMTFAAFFNLAFLVIVYQSKVGALIDKKMLSFFYKVTPLLFVFYWFIGFVFKGLNTFIFSQNISLIMTVLVSVLFYFSFSYILKIEESRKVISFFKR